MNEFNPSTELRRISRNFLSICIGAAGKGADKAIVAAKIPLFSSKCVTSASLNCFPSVCRHMIRLVEEGAKVSCPLFWGSFHRFTAVL